MKFNFRQIDFKSLTAGQIVLAAFLAICAMALLGAISLAVYFFMMSRELPSTEELKHYKYKRPTMIYDRNGKQIAELGEERRYPVALDKIPENLQNAVVAVEDARFYEHGGVDMMGILRAFVSNIRAGRVVEGGSTLTQQLVKILYLTPEKKLKRKVKEQILAYRIDKALSKKEILLMYLNQVYFGRGSYGVQAAAQNYFGKDVADLSLAECAMVAGIPKAPGIYAPHLSMDKSVKRRNHVLYRMVEVGYITESQYKEAAREIPVIVEKIQPKNLLAGYFVDYVKKYLTETEKLEDIDNSGMEIHTTLDLDMQAVAEEAVKDNLLELSEQTGYYGPVAKYLPENGNMSQQLKMDKSYLAEQEFEKALVTKTSPTMLYITTLSEEAEIKIEDSRWARPAAGAGGRLNSFADILHENDIIYVKKRNGRYRLVQDPPLEGALLSVGPQNGAIYAMVGGFDYRRSMFNRAYQAKRQAGSLLKPIVYSAALENGMDIMSQVLDAPIEKQLNEEGEVWRPKNSSGDYFGNTTLKDALTHSRNLVTIKLAEQVGIGKIIELARKFGLEGEMNRELAVSIGSNSVTLQEMVYAFSVFPNMGVRIKPYFITKLVYPDGKNVKELEPSESIPVIKESTAQIITDTLVNAVDHGTGRRALAIPRVVGGKTGTTNDSKDTWFVGYMSDLVTGAWVGFDDFKALPRGSSGSNAALPQWVRYTGKVYPKFGRNMFPVAKDVAYFRVDADTKQITDGYSEEFTFEPYDRPMSITE